MWLNQGDQITCELGHPIAVADKRLQPGRDDDWMENMTWRIKPPREGDSAVCSCGRLWHFIYRDKKRYMWWLCVNGEWHPGLNQAAKDWLISLR